MINKYDMLNNAIEAICNSAPDTFGRYRRIISGQKAIFIYFC